MLAKGALWDEGLSHALREELESEPQGPARPTKPSTVDEQKAYFRKRGKIVVDKERDAN